MAAITLSDIPLARPEREALFMVAMALTGGDTAYRANSGRAAGAWSMSIELFGQPPDTPAGQAAIASRLWQDLRAHGLSDVALDGTERMLALALVGWFVPAKLPSVKNAPTGEILSRAGIGWLSPRCTAVAGQWGTTLFAGQATPTGRATPDRPAKNSAPTTPDRPVEPGKPKSTSRMGGWLFLAALAAIAGAWWYRRAQ